MKKLATIIIYLIATLIAPQLKAQIDADRTMQIGRNALYFEDYVVAIQYFNQAIAAKPHLALPYFYRAWAKLNLDDLQGAEADATKAISLNPFITDAYELRGAARLNLGHYKEAIEDYDYALNMLPDNRLLIYNKALAQEALKDYDSALTNLDHVINKSPRFDNAITARSRLHLERGDTTAALADAARAIEVNPNATNAYLIRAGILMNRPDDYESALADIDKAIRLQPRQASLYANRAFLRYKLDDYVGAMADFDHALQLEPTNTVALFNRSLLRIEVRDFNRAIDDLNQILSLNPDDLRALYNRAMILAEIGHYKDAMSDINRLIDVFPDLSAAYFVRFDIKRRMGDRTAQRDLDKSVELGRKRIKRLGSNPSMSEVLSDLDKENSNSEEDETESQDFVARQFTQLIAADNSTNIQQQFNNPDIRGKVQDRPITIDPEPLFVVAYYCSPTELRPSGEYMKEIQQVNDSHSLDNRLIVTNHERFPTDSTEIARHFQAIQYYNSYLSTHPARAIDYFGRAMSRLTLHDYAAAEADFRLALKAAPDFALAQFMIAITKYKQSSISDAENKTSDAASLRRSKLMSVIESFQKTIDLSSDMPLAYYNQGVVYLVLKDYRSAINSFNKALSLKPDFGEAYFNRGYAHYMLGDRSSGNTDLSRAGQLGVAASYRLLKRMN